MLRLMVKFQPQAFHPNDFSPSLKMPKVKTNRGKSKKIRCPWCGKKICSETNVLQHMNQPTGLCYTVGWYKDHALRTLYQPPQDLPDSSHHPDLDLHVQMDMDVDHYDSLHLPSDQWSQGFDDDMGDIGMEVEDISDMWQSFTSIHPGCGTSFPGGSTFMDSFWQDAHAKERRENLFYPFASSEEWQFSSWCMRSGLRPVIQWSADTTEHAHIQEVKVPARLSNNQNYYNQIAHYLDRSDKCFRFNVATYFETRREGNPSEDNDNLEEEHDIELDFNNCSLHDHMNLPHLPLNYFVIANALACDSIPNAPKPHRTFSNITTAFHLTTKPSLHMTIDNAAILFKLPDLRPVIREFLQCAQNHLNHPVSGVTSQDLHYPLPFNCIQIWYKIHIQQFLYHKAQDIDAPQTLRVLPPSGDHPHGLYDMVILSPSPDSDWPQ
ncbi:hypothetical protein EDD17DRAFT_1759243 [Pisolithus thermaeus]|nr:hypothetical protein EDD17DRAFT_1759243 [Pisolithus thermaeus]